MIQDFSNLKNTYDNLYGIQESQEQELSTITLAYKKEMKELTPEIERGIGETYREYLSKGAPVYYWMLEAIHSTSKKAVSKRSLNYVIGMLRNWSQYGFGSTKTSEEIELFDYFMEVTGVDMSPEARQVLISSMTKYGILKLMRVMPELKDVDVSLFYSQCLVRCLERKFESSQKTTIHYQNIESLPEQKKSETSKENVKQIESSSSQTIAKKKSSATQTRALDERRSLMLLEIQSFLEKNGESKVKDICAYLQSVGFDEVTSESFYSKIKGLMKYDDRLKTTKFGYYKWIKPRKKKITNDKES